MEYQSFFSPIVIWFIIGLLLMIIELTNPGFILFFFGLGAWITTIVLAMFPIPIIAQLILFCCTSVILLVVFRNKFKQLFSGFLTKNSDPTKDIDEIIGKTVTVTEGINPPNRGKVQLFGSSWLAESDIKLDAGTVVTVIEKNNIVLKVAPISE